MGLNQNGYGASPLVVDSSFSFEASIRQSIKHEKLDASLDLGLTGTLSQDALQRAYDLSFGTSPLTPPSWSPSPSRAASPDPVACALELPAHFLPPRLPPEPHPSSPSDFCAPSLRSGCRESNAGVPLPASDASPPPPAPATQPRSRKRKRARRSHPAPFQANQPSQTSLPLAVTSWPRVDVPSQGPSHPPPSLPPHPLPDDVAPRGGLTRTPGKVLRDKKKSRALRRDSRQQAKIEDQSQGRTPRLATVRKHIAPAEVVKTEMDISNIPTASTGFVALPDKKGRVYTLRELLDDHQFKLIQWDGKTSRAITDSNDLVIAVLVGKPDDASRASDKASGASDSTGKASDKASWASVCEAAFQATQDAARRCSFSQDDKVHKRGNFAVLNTGISFGGGQMTPGNLYHRPRNARELATLLSHDAFQRIAGFGSGALAAWAPKLHAYYEDHLDALLCHHPKLYRNFTHSVWAACAINFGPRTVTARHRDCANLPFGLCAITALGHFDPTKGGHIVVWELKLVIEFPPGSTILLPSAAVAHSNTPIGEDETRSSFTQFSAGGLFRWTEQGFQLKTQFEATLSAEEAAEVELQNEKRCKLGLSLFSTLSELQRL